MHKSLPQSLNSRSLLEIIVLVTVLSFAACAARKSSDSVDRSSSPIAAYKAAHEAGQRGDLEGYKRGFADATLRGSAVVAESMGKPLDEFIKEEMASGIKIPEMRNEQINGDNATVEIKDDVATGLWKIESFVKEDGEWKLLRTSRTKVKFAETQNLLPPPTAYVNDFANVIDAESKQRLEEALDNLKKRRGVEFFVATVKTTGLTQIAQYTNAVLNDWGIKGERSGLLLLLAVDDRKYQFDISRQLEDKLTDDFLKQSGQLMVSSLRQGKYGEGLLKSVNAIIAKLEEQKTTVVPKIVIPKNQ